jgi:hypothetical protein
MRSFSIVSRMSSNQLDDHRIWPGTLSQSTPAGGFCEIREGKIMRAK